MTAGCAAEADSAQFFIYLFIPSTLSLLAFMQQTPRRLKAPAGGAVLFGAPHYQPTPGLSPPPCSEELPGPTPHLRPQHPTEQTPKPHTSARDPPPFAAAGPRLARAAPPQGLGSGPGPGPLPEPARGHFAVRPLTPGPGPYPAAGTGLVPTWSPGGSSGPLGSLRVRWGLRFPLTQAAKR